MAKFKVEWTVEARIDLFDILNYYFQRNGNSSYSRKLNSKIKKTINLISKNPLIGLKTDIYSIRYIINGDYHLVYEILESKILIVMVWDNRRNPDEKIVSPRIKI